MPPATSFSKTIVQMKKLGNSIRDLNVKFSSNTKLHFNWV